MSKISRLFQKQVNRYLLGSDLENVSLSRRFLLNKKKNLHEYKVEIFIKIYNKYKCLYIPYNDYTHIHKTE